MAKRSKYNWDAETVRSLRQHLQMTQSQLADELGVRQQTVSEWEKDIYTPRGATVKMLTIVAERGDFLYHPTKKSTKSKTDK